MPPDVFNSTNYLHKFSRCLRWNYINDPAEFIRRNMHAIHESRYAVYGPSYVTVARLRRDDVNTRT
jgi:hypothetical protein